MPQKRKRRLITTIMARRDHDEDNSSRTASTIMPGVNDNNHHKISNISNSNSPTKKRATLQTITPTVVRSKLESNLPDRTTTPTNVSVPWLTAAEQVELLAMTQRRGNNTTTPTATTTILSKTHDIIKKEMTLPDSNNDSYDEDSSGHETPTRFDENDTYELPQTMFFQSHCWVCEIRLKELNGTPCLYGLGLHPLLQVPICSLCCDLIVRAQDEQPEFQEDAEVCLGCGTDEGDHLFLCDCCPKVFCINCVAKSIGGGSKGMDRATSLLNNNDLGWACLVCNTPAALEEIRVDQKTDGKEGRQLSAEEKDQSTLELFEQLQRIENELTECEKWGNLQWLEKKKAKFAREFAQLYDDRLDVDERATAELAIYEERGLEHQHRLMDNLYNIQERLQCLGFDCGSYYKDSKAFQDNDYERKWRARVERGMPKLEPQQGQSSDEDSLSDASSIEDLGDDDDLPEFEIFKEKNGERKSCWSAAGQSYHTKRKKGLADRIKTENERLEKRGRRLKYFHDDDDDREFQQEQNQATVVTSGGTFARPVQRARQLDSSSQKRKEPSDMERSALFAQKPRRRINNQRVDASMSRRSALVAQSAREQRSSKDYSGKLTDSSEHVYEGTTESTATGKEFANDEFQESCLVLCTKDNQSIQRSISVAAPLASRMKSHQVEGIRFLWEKVCGDLALATRYEEAKEEKEVGGAILAHFMGLGKTAAVISLLHSLLNHPSLELPALGGSEPCRFIKKVLIIVPVNTLDNWMNEFKLWVDPLANNIVVHNFHILQPALRVYMITEWHHKGGVLLIGDRAFANISKEKQTKRNKVLSEALHSPGPDLIILDEGHTMLKNKTTLSDALGMVRTKRRITLTGTPFQNNLREYFRMASWVRPGILGTESSFNKRFMKPIEDGMARDAETEAVAMQVEKSKELYQIMEAFTLRRDSTILKEQLPPLQEAILHVRQSALQRSLYAAFKKHSAKTDDRNFFRAYKAQFLVNNHPGTLLIPPRFKATSQKRLIPLFSTFQTKSSHLGLGSNGAGSQSLMPSTVCDIIELLSDTDEDDDENDKNTMIASQKSCISVAQAVKQEEDTLPIPTQDTSFQGEGEAADEAWWRPVASKKGEALFNKIEQGKKIVLLLQILAHAQEIGDKVVIFSQSLPTLDFIENVLCSDWSVFVSNRHLLSSTLKLGGWDSQVDYYRIDGGTTATDRGALITAFNSDRDSKAFLISIEAGGIGINLCGANRVVIMDNHFNPSISSQAISRCWRYGQVKPVYAYRLLTEGSMEEKIVANLSKKTGLGARVVDQEYPERSFTRRELTQMRSNDNWIACDNCNKWRMLIFETDEEVEELGGAKWFCEMNQDPFHNMCKYTERDADWYSRNMNLLIRIKAREESEKISNVYSTSLDEVVPTADPVRDAAVLKSTKQMIQNDVILRNLGTLEIFEERKLNENAMSPVKQPKKNSSMASMLFGKVYYPDLLAIHSTKDLDAAAAYQRGRDDVATTDGIRADEQQSHPEEIVGNTEAGLDATPALLDSDGGGADVLTTQSGSLYTIQKSSAATATISQQVNCDNTSTDEPLKPVIENCPISASDESPVSHSKKSTIMAEIQDALRCESMPVSLPGVVHQAVKYHPCKGFEGRGRTADEPLEILSDSD